MKSIQKILYFRIVFGLQVNADRSVQNIVQVAHKCYILNRQSTRLKPLSTIRELILQPTE